MPTQVLGIDDQSFVIADALGKKLEAVLPAECFAVQYLPHEISVETIRPWDSVTVSVQTLTSAPLASLRSDEWMDGAEFSVATKSGLAVLEDEEPVLEVAPPGKHRIRIYRRQRSVASSPDEYLIQVWPLVASAASRYWGPARIAAPQLPVPVPPVIAERGKASAERISVWTRSALQPGTPFHSGELRVTGTLTHPLSTAFSLSWSGLCPNVSMTRFTKRGVGGEAWTFHDDEPLEGVSLRFVRMDEPELAVIGYNWLVLPSPAGSGDPNEVLVTDSTLTLKFSAVTNGTAVEIRHAGVPTDLMPDMTDWWKWHIAICNATSISH